MPIKIRFYSAYYVLSTVLSILPNSVKYVLLYSHCVGGETEAKAIHKCV